MALSLYQTSRARKLLNELLRPRPLRLIGNLLRDLRFGGRFLGGAWRDPGLPPDSMPSENSEYADLAAYFSRIRIAPGSVVVDVGCGKGRVLNYLLGLRAPIRIIGYELSPPLAHFNARRLRRYRQVEIREADITSAPELEGDIFYLYNPFIGPSLRRFVALLDREASRKPGLTVIYHNPVGFDLFAESGLWEVERCAGGAIFRAVCPR